MSGMRRTGRSPGVRLALTLLILALMLAGCGGRVVLTSGFPEDTVFRIGEEEVGLTEMRLYTLSMQKEYEERYGQNVWDGEDGEKLAALMRENALSRAARIATLSQMGRSRGLVLTDKEKALADETAREYAAGLSGADRAWLLLPEDPEQEQAALETIFERYELAVWTYRSILEAVNPEVSDDEARSVELHQILIPYNSVRANAEGAEAVREAAMQGNYENLVLDESSLSRAQRAKALLDAGEDFMTVAAEYNEGEKVFLVLSRGEAEPVIEETAYSLAEGEISGILETKEGYCILQLISSINRAQTEEKKIQIARERREEAFEQEYNRFAENLDYTLNEEQYAQVVLCRDEAVQAGGFYELCRSSFAAGEE